MNTIELTTATKSLAEYTDEFGDDVIVLTRDQHPVAAIVSLKNVDQECLALSTNAEFMAIIENGRQEIRDGKKVSLEQLKAELPASSESASAKR